ncbi:Mini-chromosome maintenance complex-binding protein isoform X4 [Oopsacas minuta]|uniref:Mini-chromosome maintenance complex-binding protein n=1 Tax=Oopsacas minuta TaxID=111878 RepID=A0AAV7JGB8_9METZ|nr:Mini-chromosome maintenance complex-binding protein isoform X4 [Oopsacas minuta]
MATDKCNFTENTLLSNPIQTLHSLADTNTDIESVLNSYQRLISPYTSRIPLLNTSTDYMNKLVYIRGMIQNISDPILYSSAVTLKHNTTSETRTIYVMFLDNYTAPDGWNILETSDINRAKHASESLLFQCVPVPNETEWCKLEWLKQQNDSSTQLKPLQVMGYTNLSAILLNNEYLLYGVIIGNESTQTLHCLFHKQVTMDTPLQLSKFNNTKPLLLKIREKLLSQLLFCVSGDKLAAEYMLYNLISRNYARCDVTQLGKFTLNLIHSSPNTSQLISYLYPKLLQRFLYLPLSLSYLNEKQFLPKKDYTSEHLITGCLQLVDSTFVLIDETRMENGRLTASGVAALAALAELINGQCVYYDFTYHRLPFNVDAPILVVTEGNKSLLPSSTILPLIPSDDVITRPELSTSDLEELRLYITSVRTMDYTLDVELQDKVQEDWVDMRKEDKELTADDLTRLLTAARYLSISRGDGSLMKETWIEINQLERERRARLNSMK